MPTQPATPHQPRTATNPTDHADAFTAITTHLATPIHTGPQAQGDLLVLPWPADTAPTARTAALLDGTPVPAAGLSVLRGARGHEHHLLPATSGIAWAPTRPFGGLTLGVLTVPPGGLAVLAHDEHADLHIGPGVYAIRRQRAHPTTDPAPQAEPENETDPWTLAAD